MTLYLGHEVHHNNHDNQHRRAAQIEGHIEHDGQELWQQADRGNISRPENCKARKNTIDIVGCLLTGAYFHQDHGTLDFEMNAVQQIQKLRPDYQYGDIRAALGRFQFASDQVDTKLKQLSGGERARVALLKLLLEDNNLLLMDEPTNHLDMESKETLEEALIGYEGSLITVSHDRWFLDQCVNRIWELKDGKIKVYYGNYTDYVRAKLGLPPLADDEISQV